LIGAVKCAPTREHFSENLQKARDAVAGFLS
jgi:hypothetical protein